MKFIFYPVNLFPISCPLSHLLFFFSLFSPCFIFILFHIFFHSSLIKFQMEIFNKSQVQLQPSQIEMFHYRASHSLKTPLNIMISLTMQLFWQNCSLQYDMKHKYIPVPSTATIIVVTFTAAQTDTLLPLPSSCAVRNGTFVYIKVAPRFVPLLSL